MKNYIFRPREKPQAGNENYVHGDIAMACAVLNQQLRKKLFGPKLLRNAPEGITIDQAALEQQIRSIKTSLKELVARLATPDDKKLGFHDICVLYNAISNIQDQLVSIHTHIEVVNRKQTIYPYLARILAELERCVSEVHFQLSLYAENHHRHHWRKRKNEEQKKVDQYLNSETSETLLISSEPQNKQNKYIKDLRDALATKWSDFLSSVLNPGSTISKPYTQSFNELKATAESFIEGYPSLRKRVVQESDPVTAAVLARIIRQLEDAAKYMLASADQIDKELVNGI